MPLGNGERSLFDEFWALWHSDRPIDRENSEPRDLWNYDDKKSPSFSAETHYCHSTPYCYKPASQGETDEISKANEFAAEENCD